MKFMFVMLIRMQKNEMYAMKCRPRTVAIDVKHAHATRKTDINRTHEPLLRHRLCGTLTYRLCRPPRENKNAGPSDHSRGMNIYVRVDVHQQKVTPSKT